MNLQLEQRIDERTLALRDALAAQQQQADALRNNIIVQQQLNETILDLALPVIPLSNDILLAPLVGNIGSERIAQLMEKVLGEFERRRVRVLVLDVTGVLVVDTAVTQMIMHVSAAVRLMGGQVLVVGIRPEIAQALVALNADLRTISTAATLHEGLLHAARAAA